MSAWLTEKRKPGIDSVMRIAGLYDLDPRLLSGDQLAFAKELADPERIQHAEVNIGHAAPGVGTVSPLRRKGAQKIRGNVRGHPASPSSGGAQLEFSRE